MEKEIMTIKEFADVMNLKEYVVRRLVKENKVVYFMSGTHAYINYPLSKKKLWNSSIWEVNIKIYIWLFSINKIKFRKSRNIDDGIKTEFGV